MNVSQLPAGRYVVAVSGGVDSMCLLHILANQPGVEVVVAHFDHAQRADSADDAVHVKETAARYGLAYAGGTAQPGLRPDENSLRQARYEFLRTVMKQHGALAIITAHHQDDFLETVIMKLMRGTNRRGLSPMQASPDIMRPLLAVTKAQLYEYAARQGLTWHEDSSNADTKYLRNAIRHTIMPRLQADQREALLAMTTSMTELNRSIDDILSERLAATCDRLQFTNWPYAVSREYIASWLRAQRAGDFTGRTLDRLTVAAKTLPPGRSVDVMNGIRLHITKQSLALETSERYNKETYG